MQSPKSLKTLEEETKMALQRNEQDKKKKIARAQTYLSKYIEEKLTPTVEQLEGNDHELFEVLHDLIDDATLLKIDMTGFELSEEKCWEEKYLNCAHHISGIFGFLLDAIEDKMSRLTIMKINRIKAEAAEKEAEIKAEAVKEFLLLLKM
jgi:hypothetical protein